MNNDYKNFYKRRLVESILVDKKYITEVERYEMPGLDVPATLAVGGNWWDNIGRALGRGGSKLYKTIDDIPGLSDIGRQRLIKNFGEDARVVPRPDGTYDIETESGRWFRFMLDARGNISGTYGYYKLPKNYVPTATGSGGIVFLGYDSLGNPIFSEPPTPSDVDDQVNPGSGGGILSPVFDPSQMM